MKTLHLTRTISLAAIALLALHAARGATYFVTTTADSGAGSLRQVISNAASSEEADEIRFSIGTGAKTITLATPLEVLSPVIIDGTTQPGFTGTPIIVLNGGGLVSHALRLDGGRCTVRGLVIQDFAGPGLLLERGGGSVIQGNFIGTDLSGTLARGNGFAGVQVLNSSANLIGGTGAGQGNVISGNGVGVFIEGERAFGNLVQGNFIGTRAGGSGDLANGGPGVAIGNSAAGNTVGGSDAGAANRIAFNADGVLVAGNDTTGNVISRNAIYFNTGLGINLRPIGEGDGVVTLNDPLDGDPGPNHLQNFPEITSVSFDGATTIVRGSLQSEVGNSYRIELFRSTTPGPGGYGQGETFVGSATVTTDGGGNALFSVSASGWFPDQFFAATATALSSEDTSEFSRAYQADPGTLTFSAFTYAVDEDIPTARASITVQRLGGSYGRVTVNYATSTRFATSGWAVEGTTICYGANDYLRAAGTLAFGDGDSADKRFEVLICNDTRAEGDENVSLTLSSPTGGAALDELKKEATLFIRDDDITLSIDDTSVLDTCAPFTTKAVFTVTLSAPSRRDVTVHFATSPGTALAGADYISASGTLTIPAESPSGKIEVIVLCDTAPEGFENFFVTLSDPVNARLKKSIGECSISDLRFISVYYFSYNQIRFTFGSAAGSLYRLEYARGLGPNAGWLPVPGAEFFQGNGQVMELIDPDTSNRPQSFYRLVLLQQPGPPQQQGGAR